MTQRKGETERDISLWLVHFPNGCKSQVCTRLKPGGRISILASKVGDRGPSTLTKISCLHRYIRRKLSWKQSWTGPKKYKHLRKFSYIYLGKHRWLMKESICTILIICLYMIIYSTDITQRIYQNSGRCMCTSVSVLCTGYEKESYLKI